MCSCYIFLNEKKPFLETAFLIYFSNYYLTLKVTLLTNFLANSESFSTEASSPAGTTFNLDSATFALINTFLTLVDLSEDNLLL